MRKLLGIIVLFGFMVTYIAVVASMGEHVARLAKPIQTIFFATAGIVWVLPLRPLIEWMHRRE